MDQASMDYKLAAIETTQERILEHHREMKQDLKQIMAKFEDVNKAIADEVLIRQKEISALRRECDERERTIYRNVAGGGVGVIITMLAAFFWWVVEKFK